MWHAAGRGVLTPLLLGVLFSLSGVTADHETFHSISFLPRTFERGIGALSAALQNQIDLVSADTSTLY